MLFATQTMSRRDKGDAMDETPFGQVLSGKLLNILLLCVVVGSEVLGLSFNTSFLIVVQYSECHWPLNISTAWVYVKREIDPSVWKPGFLNYLYWN